MEQSGHQLEEPPKKVKRIMNEKQLEVLKRGRENGIIKLKEYARSVKAKNEIKKEYIKILEQQNKEQDDNQYIQMKAEMDFYNMSKLLMDLHSKLDKFIMRYDIDKAELYDYQNTVVKQVAEKQLPRVLEQHFLKQKLEAEKQRNPYLGQV